MASANLPQLSARPQLLSESTETPDSVLIDALIEDVLRKICRQADVVFVGKQPGFDICPDMLLFTPKFGPCKGSTLSVPLTEASPLKISLCVVVREIEANEAYWLRTRS